MGAGINTEVIGGSKFGEAGERLVGLEFSGAAEYSQLGKLGVDCLSHLTKHPAPTFPRRNPKPRALMDLGMNGAQSEWSLILGFDFSLASRTGVGIVLIT